MATTPPANMILRLTAPLAWFLLVLQATHRVSIILYLRQDKSLAGFLSIILIRMTVTIWDFVSSNECQVRKTRSSIPSFFAAWNQAAIDGANRSSAAYSYLADEYSSRENLYILIRSRVSRVLPTDNNVTFRAVEFAQDLEGLFLPQEPSY